MIVDFQYSIFVIRTRYSLLVIQVTSPPAPSPKKREGE